MLGGQFNQELAEQFKLEELAFQRLIQKYLLLNYADDLGLLATDEEVAAELVKNKAFFKDGKFNKDTYLNVLKQNRRSATQFEDQLKQGIVINKVENLFSTPLQKNELENISNLVFSEDEVSIKVINDDNIKIKYTQKDLEEYWSQNKDNYKSESGFGIAYTKIDNIEGKTKKEMKKIALKQYLNLKKGKEKFQSKKTIYTSSKFLNAEDLKAVTSSDEGTILKPIYKDNNYYIIKAEKKILPQVLEYADVKKQVLSDYKVTKKTELLEKSADKIIANFKGKNLGYIGKSDKPMIEGLSDIQRDEFLKQLFSSNKTINKVNFGSTIVVYKILNSKFGTFDPSKAQAISHTIENLKESSLLGSLLAKLATKYEIKSFMGNK